MQPKRREVVEWNTCFYDYEASWTICINCFYLCKWGEQESSEREEANGHSPLLKINKKIAKKKDISLTGITRPK